MPKIVLFIHSAGPQGPGEGSGPLLARLRSSLEPDVRIVAPAMPAPSDPDCEAWYRVVRRAVDEQGDDVVILGHSLGGSVVVKYLSEHARPHGVSAAFIVAAPFWGADPDWPPGPFALPVGFGEGCRWLQRLHLVYSPRDEVVPFTHLGHYRAALPWAQIHALEAADHQFLSGDVAPLVDALHVEVSR